MNTEYLNAYISEADGDIKRLPYLKQFVEYLDERNIEIKNVTEDIINEYLDLYPLRKHTLVHFRTHLKSFLEYLKVNLDFQKVTSECETFYYTSYESMMLIIGSRIANIEKEKEIRTKFDSYKALITLEWMGIPSDKIKDILLTDISEDGIMVDGKLYTYLSDEMKEYLLWYKDSKGFYTNNRGKAIYTVYQGNYLVRVGDRGLTCDDRTVSISRVRKNSGKLGLDSRLITLSAELHYMYWQEQKGVKPVFNNYYKKNAYQKFKEQKENV